MDLTPIVVEALGKRIDDAAAVRVAIAIGKKPFRSATPNERCDIGDRKRLGIEVVANMILYNRDYWPPRKEGRKWLTFVTNVFIYPNYTGTLPEDFDWRMDDAALSARFERMELPAINQIRFVLKPPREGLIATTTLGDDARPRLLYLAVAEEWKYATRYPDSVPENCVENGFLAAWCAMSGLLREDRVSEAALSALRERKTTPLTFFSTALDGLLWSGDVKPEYRPFCKAYTANLANEDEGSAYHDVKDIFGSSNHFRREGEAKTPDDWASYDKIEPVLSRRLDEWRRGEKWRRARGGAVA